MRIVVIGLAMLLHGMAGCSNPDADHADPSPTTPTTSTAAATLKGMAELRKLTTSGPDGPVVGWANLTEAAGRLTIHGTIIGGGLNATQHGLHVHQTGDCGSDGTTPGSKAGGHFNPNNNTHGTHAGDLGNIATDANGKGDRTVLPAELKAPLTLSSGQTYTIMGRSVIVHANPDDGTTNPAGNSGTRMLCGVIAAA